MRAIRQYGAWVRWSMVLALVASLAVYQLAPIGTGASQTESDIPSVVEGTPVTEDSSSIDMTDGTTGETAPAEESPVEPVISLVQPLSIVVDTTTNTNELNPCSTIDPGWTFVLVQPWSETFWVDPSTGLGGGLAMDQIATPPAFGWDTFQGGTVEGVVVPDAIDGVAVSANFYDYRPFFGAIASDAGLSSPSGEFVFAYLCVPAPVEPVDSPVPSATETAVPELPVIETPTGTAGTPFPADVAVEPAAIGIGSNVRIAESLNLRAAAGLNAPVIAVLAAGSIVSVVGGPQTASGYVWWQLSTSSGTGWSVVDYLVEQPVTATPIPSPTRTPTVVPDRAIGIGSTVRVKQLLNLRDQPTTSGAVLAVMPTGTMGTVVDGPRTANGYTWWQISTPLGTGWAAAPYLEKTTGPAGPTNTPTLTPTAPGTNTATPTVGATGTASSGIALGDLVQTTTRVNLRSAPGTQAAPIAVLSSGGQWPVIDGPAQASGMTWWQLQTASGSGWVAAQYLRRIGVAPSPTITRTPSLSPTATQTRTPSLTPTMTRTPSITPTPGSCGSFGYGDIVRTTDSVNFRSQPTTSSSIIRTLSVGERGTVRGGPVSANGYSWCQIQIGASTGWVASPYLARVSGPMPTPNGTVTPRPSPPAPPSGGSSSVIYRGSSASGMIALTFDAGAERGKAAYILDVLASYGVHATFGMTGLWARDNPDLVQRMVSEGHQLINHTWDHPSFTGESTSTTVLTRSGRIDQLDRAEAIVAQISGYQMKPYWRPPYGDINASVLRDAYAGGYYVAVMWTCDTLAWNGASVQQILNRCMYPSGAGSIILMHVGSDGLDWAATEDMIRYFQGKGLQLVTIETLLGG